VKWVHRFQMLPLKYKIEILIYSIGFISVAYYLNMHVPLLVEIAKYGSTPTVQLLNTL
jgi:hypothetical protein